MDVYLGAVTLMRGLWNLFHPLMQFRLPLLPGCVGLEKHENFENTVPTETLGQFMQRSL